MMLKGRKVEHMDWMHVFDAVLACSTILLVIGIAATTLVVCLIYDKATDHPENFAKVLATVKEQTRWFRPRPRE